MIEKFQGDVAFVKLENADVLDKRQLKPSGNVLAEGEVTGHMHELVTDTPDLVEVLFYGVGHVIQIAEGGSATVVHPDHGEITLDEGVWYQYIQREFADTSNRWVRD